ncbi:calcium channel protein [Entomophthora muscae]|uniref:Calcium channel protein n=1 Tax=Entomophthora muscae TaxID=34485 RepID=A0ACC2S9T4_9FUNG|nr:calcium channel protein [Entomophthora muscae]
MKGLFKTRPLSPSESYPLTVIPLVQGNSSQFDSELGSADFEDEEPQPPGSPDSQTPLKNNLRSSIHFPFFKPSVRRRKGSMAKLNQGSGRVNGEASTGLRHNFIPWVKERLSFLPYYLRYAWFLMKCASSRTMTLPIGFSTPPSLEKGIQTAPVLIGRTFKIFSPQNPIRSGLARLFQSAYSDVFLTLVIIVHWAVLLSCTWEAGERLPEATEKTDRPLIKITLICVFSIYTLEAIARMIVGGFSRMASGFPKLATGGRYLLGRTSPSTTGFTPAGQLTSGEALIASTCSASVAFGSR